MEKMEDVIQRIIETKIPNECVFDAHTIIEYLIQNESDIYLSSHEHGWKTKSYHSIISKTIDNFSSGDNRLVKRIGDCWSMNIHKKFSKNTCWRKLGKKERWM